MSKLKTQNSKLLLASLIMLILLLTKNTPVFAAKKRVVVKKVVPTVAATRPTVYVKIRKDRKAINLTFYNLNTANSVAYELTYLGSGIEQGVVGAVSTTEGNTATRELLLGTCSKNVCTYHKNVTSVKLKTTSKLKTGKTIIKRFTIKV